MSEPVMLYYDANGKRVPAPVAGGRQFKSNDPSRPDAKAPKAEPEPQPAEEVQAVEEEEAEEKATEKPPATKARTGSKNK